MKRYSITLAVFIVVFIIFNSVYILDQRQSALVLQFGEPMREVHEAGLQFKIPGIQKVLFFDNRIQNLIFSPGASSELMAMDQKTMTMDAFAKYKITDPLKFYQSVQNEQKFKMRIGSILESSIREVVGTIPFIDVLTAKRNEMNQQITNLVNDQAQHFGIDVLDVRVIRVNLPEKAQNAVYGRMQTERVKEATEIRARGAEEANIITASAERDRAILLADARKQAEVLKGEGEAEAARIFATAANQDADFFTFYRTMQAYKTSLLNSNTTLVLTPDSDFLKYISGQ